MITNTGFGSWYNHQGHELTIQQSVIVALGDYGDDYDVDAITRDWRAAINEALPDTVTLSGDEFYGPAHDTDRDWEGDLDITSVIEAVDFWALAARHELWTIDQVAEELGYTTATAEAAARKKLSAWGVKAAVHKPNPRSGRVQAYYSAQQVKAAKAARPGQGNRGDLETGA
jgi:hypothetical protein